MKKAIFLGFLMVVTFTAGCGSQLTAGGAGLTAGILGSKTLEGIEKDLELQEKDAIERYNRMVEAGVKAESLAEVRAEIERLQYLRQGVQTGKNLLGVDWNDPTEAGSGIGLVATLLYAIFTKRKLNTVLAGVNDFKSKHDPNISDDLETCMAKKKA